MDLQVPLNRLKFGQEDGAGINARVVGRRTALPSSPPTSTPAARSRTWW
jgi:hypothetical protein